jgi:hypothetical protein
VSDYFDRVERGMREAMRRGAHEPWYLRLRVRLSRPVMVAVACLVVCGSALAATGVFRTGAPVGSEVPPNPSAYEGAVIARTVRLLPLRVSDPDGGPPWALRVLKTTRGLMCLQVGRVVDGRLGALGEDGAFGDDGAFHPLSLDYLSGLGCGTQDAHGNAFLNEQLHAVPASALFGNALSSEQRDSAVGCYASKSSSRVCPPSNLRDVDFGLLGPDATRVTYATPTGAMVTTPTTGEDGAYLIVLPHKTKPCGPPQPFCVRGQGDDEVIGPELEYSETIRTVTYRDAPACHLPSSAQAAEQQASKEAEVRAVLKRRYPEIYRTLYYSGRYIRDSVNELTLPQQRAFAALRAPYLRTELRRPRCPAVGYTPLSPSRHITEDQVSSPITVHAEPARFYCEHDEDTVPCDGPVPNGYKRLDLRGGPPQLLLVIQFTSRIAITNFDSHYEINKSDPNDPTSPQCPSGGASSFGPTQTNLKAGQRVRYTTFVNPQCRGVSHITVGLVTVNGPSGAMPVPGLPGQSAEIPVGQANFRIP